MGRGSISKANFDILMFLTSNYTITRTFTNVFESGELFYNKKRITDQAPDCNSYRLKNFHILLILTGNNRFHNVSKLQSACSYLATV